MLDLDLLFNERGTVHQLHLCVCTHFEPMFKERNTGKLNVFNYQFITKLVSSILFFYFNCRIIDGDLFPSDSMEYLKHARKVLATEDLGIKNISGTRSVTVENTREAMRNSHLRWINDI